MNLEIKEKIDNRVRKEHGIALDDKDPIYAVITANEIILEEQLKQLHAIFENQLIDMEQITKNYLTNAKELLEKRLTLALKNAKKELEEPKPQIIEKEKTTFAIPIISLVIGFILGYGLSLFIL